MNREKYMEHLFYGEKHHMWIQSEYFSWIQQSCWENHTGWGDGHEVSGEP